MFVFAAPSAATAMWCILADPCGLACYTFGVCVVLFVDFVTMSEIVWPWLGGSPWGLGLANAAFFQTIIALILSSYIKAATTDPGAVALHSATRADLYAPESDPLRAFKPRRRFCERCECVKPPRAHHCSTCKRCVNKMDHHCPWVNNCVGSNNLKFFLLFLLYTCIGGSYAALMAGARAFSCWRGGPGSCPEPSLYTVVTVVLAAVLGLFFAIFTLTMAYDQWEGAVTSTTGIESMKGWAEERRPLADALREIFGEPFGLRWFLPVDIHETGEHTGFYAWAPGDDMDSYDVRDPAIGRHFTRIESVLAQEAESQTPEEAEAARQKAVAAAAEIHRLHAIKRGPRKPAAAAAAVASAPVTAATSAAVPTSAAGPTATSTDADAAVSAVIGSDTLSSSDVAGDTGAPAQAQGSSGNARRRRRD